MTITQRRNRLTTPFSEGIPVVKLRITIIMSFWSHLLVEFNAGIEIFNAQHVAVLRCTLGSVSRFNVVIRGEAAAPNLWQSAR